MNAIGSHAHDEKEGDEYSGQDPRDSDLCEFGTLSKNGVAHPELAYYEV